MDELTTANLLLFKGRLIRFTHLYPPFLLYSQMEVDEAEEEEEEEELHFSGQDLMKIREAVTFLVQSLLSLLQTFPLKDRLQTASNCTQVTLDSPTWPLHTKLQGKKGKKK